MVHFLKSLIHHFLSKNTFQKGASLAYYAVFSFLPIIVIVISILGIIFGKQAVSGDIFTGLQDTLGPEGAGQIQGIIKNQHENHNSILTAVVGFATLILGASGLFSQIHNALNAMWNIKAKPKNTVLRYFKKHLLSFAVLIFLFFIILISSAVSSFLVKHEMNIHPDYKLLSVYEHIISFLIVCLIFFIIFKSLTDAILNWKTVFWGSIFTAVLFTFGKLIIADIIGKSHLNSTFGSASVLAAIMLWVYYISQIIFLGSSFIYVLSERLERPILPNSEAVLIQNIELENR